MADLRVVGQMVQADFVLRLGDTRKAEMENAINERLQTNDADLLAWVVGALNLPSLRQRLRQRIEEFPSDLAVQLAVADGTTAHAVWDNLSERNSRAQYLIDLVRVVRAQDNDQNALGRLHKWLNKPEGKDTYQTFLKRHVRPVLESTEEKVSNADQVRLCNAVLHDAIRQKVNITLAA